MKKEIRCAFLALAVGVFSFAQNPSRDFAIITGKMDINWSKSIKLSTGPITLIDPWINRLSAGDTLVDLSKEGDFKIKLPILSPGFFSISHENNKVELFISPNDSLFINFSADQVVTGTSAAINNHLQSLRDLINSNRRFINGMDFYERSSKDVDVVLDSLETIYSAKHNDFKRNHPVVESFDKKVLADFSYRRKLYKLVHPAIYKERTNSNLSIPENYFQNIAEGSFNDPDLLKSLDYVLFLDSYLDIQSAGIYKYDVYFEAPIEKIHTKYKQIQQLNAHQAIKDYLYHQHLDKSIDNYGVSYLGDLPTNFKNDCKNADYVNQIILRYSEGKKRREEASEIKIYKTVGDIELEAHIFYPQDFKPSDSRAAYAFFHGGGWSIGIPEWGYKNCEKYSGKGMVAISFEYRLLDVHNSNLLDCVRDAKSAISWIREQAKSLGVDPNKIVAAGFSAGGHLAACTAILNDYEDDSKSGLSKRPNALIVHSASYNTLKNNWFNKRSGNKAKSISTFHQLGENLVPAIFFHGTEDHLAPIDEFNEFKNKMDSLGNTYEYEIFEGVGHFFNNSAARKKVGLMTDSFLSKLGYLQ
nr:alpha/beta hydrolase [Allomuricauda sp.]